MNSKAVKHKTDSGDVGVTERDRLSAMPDEILLHILSFLPTIYAVRTTKIPRFRDLWTMLPILRFDDDEYYNADPMYMVRKYDDNLPRFCLFVRNVLNRHKRSTIDEFHITLATERYFEIDYRFITDELRFAFARQVKELVFRACVELPSIATSVLPALNCQSLVKLQLCHCGIEQQHQVHLPSLKILSLDTVYMCDEAFQRLISGSPSLQELSIISPIALSQVRFTAPNIEKLYLYLTVPLDWEDVLVFLDCPNLKVLSQGGLKFPKLIDVSSVCELYFDFYGYCDILEELISSVLARFSNAQVFSCDSAEDFLCNASKFVLTHFKWRRVILGSWVLSTDSLLGFCQLLRSLSHLEELIIYADKEHECSNDFLSLELHVPQLKRVTIHWYCEESEEQLHLVQLLLKSAVALDELRLVSMKPLTGAAESKFVKRVSSFTKASKKATIVFS